MDESRRFLILSLEGGSFALPIARLLEITMPRGIQKDSDLAAVFEGKFEFRSTWIPVLNLKKIFQLLGRPGGVLLVVKGMKGIVGILVDAVTEIIDADQKPAPLPAGVMNPTLRHYAGVIRHKGELILLLNEDGLLQ
jgi:chemotaxis signal transduction protein